MVACSDKDGEAVTRASSAFHINGYDDHVKMLAREDLDAVVVATPVTTHKQIVLDCLEAGCDVLCEKPLDVSVDYAEAMAKAAERAGRILMVGHVFLYNGGILSLKDLIDSGELGDIHYVYARRTNLGPVRYDVGALADLATHDISIINHLLNDWNPKIGSAFREAITSDEREDVAFFTMSYYDHTFAHVHVSWLDPVKVRQITVVGSKKMAVWDDLRPEGPIAIYDQALELTEDKFEIGSFATFKLKEHHGGVVIPATRNGEPLKNQAKAFVHSVRTREAPLSDAETGVAMARTLQAIRSKR